MILLLQECTADVGVARWNIGKTLSSLNDSTLNSMEMGFFHAGLEVCNVEYSYGWCEQGTGVYSCLPKASPGYTYRTTIELGRTLMTRKQIETVIRRMVREWPGTAYRCVRGGRGECWRTNAQFGRRS